MSKSIRTLLILGVLLVLCARSLPAEPVEKGQKSSYQSAVDRLGDLDLNKAYELADKAVKNSPDDAEKAMLLKVVISTIKLQSFDMLRKKYADGLKEAVLPNDKKGSRDGYVEATAKMVSSGRSLVSDMKTLFEYAGKPQSIEVRKNYDDLVLLNESYKPYKIVESGFPPAPGERAKVERLQYSMSLNFVVGRLLGDSMPGGGGKIMEDANRRRVLKGDVDWVGCMTVVGDWLIHHATVCKVGWIHPAMGKRINDLKQARSGYETARQCFEMAAKLAVGSRDKRVIRARQRIKEIKKTLNKMR